MRIHANLCVVLSLALAPVAHAQTTTRVSVDSTGGQANGSSLFPPSISADGSVVAFTTWATNLIPNDTNGIITDIFVHDLETGLTRCVSVDSTGVQGDSYCAAPTVSADGRFVAFSSVSTNLVPNDSNNVSDVFVHDRATGSTTLVSVDSKGRQGDGASFQPWISGDGQVVSFLSLATNLVPRDNNGAQDVFVHDRTTGVTRRVSVASSGREANDASYDPFLSADGGSVAFYSYASNLVPGDTNGLHDIFVHDLATRQTTRVSVHSDGSQANETSWSSNLSADGRYIAFSSFASNLVDGDTNGVTDIFVHDRLAGTTRRVSVDSDGVQADSHCEEAFISGDGMRVAFKSWATNLIPDDANGLAADIFVHDLRDGTTVIASVHGDGTQSDDSSFTASLSWDGERVAFLSWAENLVDGDTNEEHDIFVHDFSRPVGTSYCVSAPNSAGDGALIAAKGSASVAANELTLKVTGSVPSMPGLFFHGPGQGKIPYGDGFLCVAPPFTAVFPAPHIGALGSGQQWLDNSDPAHAPSFMPGATLYFQWWYRDPAASLKGFNLSDALAVTLEP